jgi:serine protease Do
VIEQQVSFFRVFNQRRGMNEKRNIFLITARYFGMLTMLFTVICTKAQTLSPEENYALNRPGVVMIKTVFSASVYVNKMKINNKRFNLLVDSIQRIDTNGIIFTPEQKLDIVLREMNNNPARFFKATFDYIKQIEEITATGTGFFITGDGYVATNSHLIDRDNAFIRRHFILTAFQQITDASIAALEVSWATTFTEQQRSLLYNTYASVYSRLFSMVLNDLKKNIYVVYRRDTANHATISETKRASVVIKGMPMPGKDVAILKIDSDAEVPTLKISAEKLPQVGEQLYVYGYPAPVTNNDFVAAESAIEPTFTTGIVSAIKNSVNGWPVIQTDANINHGSSGGPVCNIKGEVIGLTTFGSIENGGGLAAGLNFAIPVMILKEYLDSAGIVPKPSRPARLFAEGLDWYEKKHYSRALKVFEEMKKMKVSYPSLELYITNSKSAIERGADEGSKNILNFILIVVLSLLVVIPYILLLRRKRK